MFKMWISTQVEYHKQRTVVATDKKSILWKMDFNLPNPKFNYLCIILYTLIWNKNPLESRSQWDHSGTSKVSGIRYALSF